MTDLTTLQSKIREQQEVIDKLHSELANKDKIIKELTDKCVHLNSRHYHYDIRDHVLDYEAYQRAQDSIPDY